MASSITNINPAQPVAQSTGPSQKTTQPKPQAATTGGGTDTVQLSSAAQAALALQKEIQETSSQTIQEAGSGDLQAQRLLAKEAAKSPQT
jgi:hypothetical protein